MSKIGVARAVILRLIYGAMPGMGSKINLEPLGIARVLQAYPLVREATPEISLEAWCTFAHSILRERRRIGNACGITAACSENDYLRGFFAYRVAPDIQHGRALFVEFLAVSGLFSPLDVAMVLLDGIEAAAHENRCQVVHAELPSLPDWLDTLLHERGFGCRPCSLCKPLKPVATLPGEHPPAMRTASKIPARSDK